MRRRSTRGDDVALRGPQRHLDPRLQAKLGEDVLDVDLGCPLGDHQRLGNRAIAQAAGKQRHDFAFARREGVDRDHRAQPQRAFQCWSHVHRLERCGGFHQVLLRLVRMCVVVTDQKSGQAQLD